MERLFGGPKDMLAMPRPQNHWSDQLVPYSFCLWYKNIHTISIISQCRMLLNYTKYLGIFNNFQFWKIKCRDCSFVVAAMRQFYRVHTCKCFEKLIFYTLIFYSNKVLVFLKIKKKSVQFSSAAKQYYLYNNSY